MPAPHHSIFTGRMLFLSPNQRRQSTEGNHGTERNDAKKELGTNGSFLVDMSETGTFYKRKPVKQN